MKNKTKKLSKAYGLKSSIALDDEVILTSFGRGNDSVLEHKLDCEKNIVQLSETPKFNMNYNNFDDTIEIALKNKSIQVNNPLKSNVVGEDYIGVKSVLEKKMFGKEYNDNLHVQIAYNILDISKIISLYYYNLVYSLNNLKRKNLDEKDKDAIGSFRFEYKYGTNDNQMKLFNIFKDYATPYLKYYGSIFKVSNKENKINSKDIDVHNYNVLRLLSLCRNFLAHNTSDLFKLDVRMKTGVPELLNLLDDIFECDYKEINKSFNKNAQKNLLIVLNILEIYYKDDIQIDEIFKHYYNFAIFKESKNIGVNIKKIRETIYALNQFNGRIDDHCHDSYRPKMNTVFDFIIYKYLHLDNPNLELEMIDALRRTMNDDEKNDCYLKYGKIIFSDLCKKYRKVRNLAYEVKKIAIKQEEDKFNFKDKISEMANIGKISTFSKMVYFISKFLDGKEINELYSGLINKLDNINGLINTLNLISGEKVVFKDDYRLFNNNVADIASELRICRSISKMNSEMTSIKKQLYKDALAILNVRDEIFEDSEKLNQTLDEFLEKEKKQKQFRNFIINNVIKSKRFIYVIKYMNPRHCIKFIQSNVVLDFVLNELPEEQINRYHKSCFGDILCSKEDKIKDLKNALINLNFESIKEKEELIVNASQIRNNKPIEFERLKSLVGLYLTVIYLVTKSLVKINSVHIIAMQCFERDYQFIKGVSISGNSDISQTHYWEHSLDLLDRMLEINRFKKHTSKYMLENKEYYNKLPNNKVFRIYRDKVLHLEFITNSYKYLNLRKMTSYYDLYEYVSQRYLLDFVKPDNELWLDYKKDVLEYQFYSKNMTKIIKLPLAYNLARYKNLTIADLYNDKYDKKEE